MNERRLGLEPVTFRMAQARCLRSNRLSHELKLHFKLCLLQKLVFDFSFLRVFN